MNVSYQSSLKRKCYVAVMASLLSLSSFVTSTVHAGPGKALSRQQAIELATAQQPGKVLKVKRQKGSKGGAYRIKILTHDGRVKVVTVDSAATTKNHK